MGLGFGVLGWASRGAKVEMPGRVGETMEEGRRGSWAHGLVRSFVVFLTLSAPKMLVSDGDKDEVYKWKQEKHKNDNEMLG